MNPPKIAVVILNWNGAALLEQFLPSVCAYSEQAVIYVADNASTDDSVSVVQSKFPQVKIIQNTQNLGFAGGYNQALKNVPEEILALVNSDIEVTENWLQPILEIFENEPQTGMVQPKILDFKNKSMFEYAGAAGGYIDQFGFPFCRGRLFDTLEPDQGQYDERTQIFWASGACLFIRKEIFETLGGFDTDFFAHQEEIDLCWRANNLGFRAIYEPNSTVFHVGGATLQQGNPQKTFLNFRNSLFMLTKNLPTSRLFPVLFIRLSLDGIAGIQFLIKRQPMHCWAVLRSHFWFYFRLPKNCRKRTQKQSNKYYLTTSIVYQYFVRRKKRFQDIF
ncbi:MAG: glycosyltransferase family 2 protein [Flavobacteriaceae bacterium]